MLFLIPGPSDHFSSLSLPYKIFQDYEIETASSYLSWKAFSPLNKWGDRMGTSLLTLFFAFWVDVLSGAESSIHCLEEERKKDKVKKDLSPCPYIAKLLNQPQQPSLPRLPDMHGK